MIDISVTVRETMPVWPGEPPPRIERTSSLERGDSVTVSELSCGVHTGTHLDAPAHFIPGGDTVDSVPLDALCGEAVVVHMRDVAEIGPSDLEEARIPASTSRLLIRTPNSAYWDRSPDQFVEGFTALTEDGARWIAERGIGLVGIDYLSVQAYGDPEARTHHILLGSGCLILEGVDLSNVREGRYELLCLPLKLEGAEGAPVRAALRSAKARSPESS